ncbi:hypothetical protein FKM82_008471 [Ascaphus truei]
MLQEIYNIFFWVSAFICTEQCGFFNLWKNMTILFIAVPIKCSVGEHCQTMSRLQLFIKVRSLSTTNWNFCNVFLYFLFSI